MTKTLTQAAVERGLMRILLLPAEVDSLGSSQISHWPPATEWDPAMWKIQTGKFTCGRPVDPK